MTATLCPLERYFRRRDVSESRMAFCGRVKISPDTLWELLRGEGNQTLSLLIRIEEATRGEVKAMQLARWLVKRRKNGRG